MVIVEFRGLVITDVRNDCGKLPLNAKTTYFRASGNFKLLATDPVENKNYSRCGKIYERGARLILSH